MEDDEILPARARVVTGPPGGGPPRGGITGPMGSIGTCNPYHTDCSNNEFISFYEPCNLWITLFKIRNTPLLKLIYKFIRKDIKIDEIKKYLENNPDEINSSLYLAPPNDDKSLSPLTLLVHIENFELIDVFLKAGADVNIIFNNKILYDISRPKIKNMLYPYLEPFKLEHLCYLKTKIFHVDTATLPEYIVDQLFQNVELKVAVMQLDELELQKLGIYSKISGRQLLVDELIQPPVVRVSAALQA